MCEKTNSSTYISNRGSENYVNIETLKKKKINHYFVNYINYKYNQNQVSFTPNLTVFDMLFFCGQKKTENIIKDTNNIEISKNFEKL